MPKYVVISTAIQRMNTSANCRLRRSSSGVWTFSAWYSPCPDQNAAIACSTRPDRNAGSANRLPTVTSVPASAKTSGTPSGTANTAPRNSAVPM